MRYPLLRNPVLVLVLAWTVLLFTGGSVPASADVTFSPTRFDDPEPDGCHPADCSLREAVIAANDSPGHDTITLAAGQYDVNLVTTFHGEQVTAPLSLTDNTSVIGQGADRTRLQGHGVGGIFVLQHPFNVSFSVHIADLTIQGGLRDGGGGGIYAASGVSLNISGVSMTGNGGGGGVGGAILSYGAVTITDSTIADNWAQEGGAIYGGSPLTVTNSTISGNKSAKAAIVNSAGNLTNVTVTENTLGTGNTGGLWGIGLNIRNSIVSGNTGSQCVGVTSLGQNVYSDNSCGLGPGDLPSTDPMLGPLADNGGPTLTHALLAGSPAIDAGDNNGCPSADQRGIPRPQGVTCDIGAYEYVAPATPAPTQPRPS